MATDIVYKELKAVRDARWKKAFADDIKDKGESTNESAAEDNATKDREDVNRKATIVIEVR